MNKLFHNSISILMAFVVLFSTMSFTINSHYCGDMLMGTSIFKDADTCGMEPDVALLPSTCSMTKPDCCKNEQSIVKGQDELKLNFDKLSLNPHVFVAVFLQTYNNLFEDFTDLTPSSNNYPPPNIVRHIYKLDESYII